MFHAVCCLLLSYVAIVAQLMGGPIAPASRHWPALVAVLAVRWFSPTVSTVWAFGIGVAVDAAGTGPLGCHAALLVLISAILSRGTAADVTSTAGWWLRAVLLAALCDSLIPVALETIPAQQWQRLQDAAFSCATTALLTAVTAGCLISISRRLTHQPRWTGY